MQDWHANVQAGLHPQPPLLFASAEGHNLDLCTGKHMHCWLAASSSYGWKGFSSGGSIISRMRSVGGSHRCNLFAMMCSSARMQHRTITGLHWCCTQLDVGITHWFELLLGCGNNLWIVGATRSWRLSSSRCCLPYAPFPTSSRMHRSAASLTTTRCCTPSSMEAVQRLTSMRWLVTCGNFLVDGTLGSSGYV